ncbi:hypothetical protein F4821DRAFT_168710, partial [Hypoxylon rubiginosum]
EDNRGLRAAVVTCLSTTGKPSRGGLRDARPDSDRLVELHHLSIDKMCFTELIGYTCAYTSLSVKRFCPLTTQLHNNPCCTNNAVRPILAPNFCYGCARVIHGRWVDILESEHRCTVVFPHLQQPRVVSHYADDADDWPAVGFDDPNSQRRNNGERL